MAVGSPLGQSIYKALLRSLLPLKLFRADISEMAAGFYLQDGADNIILPPVNSENYFDALKAILEEYEIDVIFPVIGAEHTFFANNMEYFIAKNIKIVTPEKTTFDLCHDKYQSMFFLKNNGVNVPDTTLCNDNEDLEAFLARNQFPLFIKPRYGTSSQDTFLVKKIDELVAIRSAFSPNYFVVQEYLYGADEYTVGVYISRNRKLRETFIIKRELKFGLSYKGEVIEDKLMSNFCLNLCTILDTYYSTNVQIKLVDGFPCAFEINPRLSSTTAIRARFGFNEPEMIIWELFNDISVYRHTITRGKFMRYWEEIYLDEQ
jgi:carbamoyl-phosphate synthase large subunit